MRRATCTALGVAAAIVLASCHGTDAPNPAAIATITDIQAARGKTREASLGNLEKAMSTQGTTVVMAYTEIGAVQGSDGANLVVDAWGALDSAEAHKKAYGLSIEMKGDRHGRSYLDDDEIDQLLGEIDSASKPTSRPLKDFQVVYASRSGFLLVMVNDSEGNPGGAALAGAFGQTFLNAEQLGGFRKLVASAKGAVDDARRLDQPGIQGR